MGTIYSWLQTHPLDLPVIMFLINCAISNMPDPDSSSSSLYRWFYGTSHAVIGGLGNAIYAAKTSSLNAPEVKK